MMNTESQKEIEHNAMIQHLTAGIKGIFFVNGGAVIALLAFFGHILGNENIFSILINILKIQEPYCLFVFCLQPIFIPILLFIFGLFLGILSAFLLNITQYKFWTKKPNRYYWRRVAVIVICSGLALFLLGGFLAVMQFDYIIRNFPIK